MYVDTSCSESGPTATPRLQRASGRARAAFRLRAGASRLHRLHQDGCAKIRLPRRTQGEAAEAVVINTSGGLTGGDRLDVEIEVEAGASATVTTQACERIYRSTGDDAEVSAALTAAMGASLAWLPQETILFDGGRLSRRLSVALEGDAEFLAVEAVIFGRTAMGERLSSGLFRDRWRIRRDGKLIFADDLRIDGDMGGRLTRSATLAGRLAMATVFYSGADAEPVLEPLRGVLGDDGGASAWSGKLVARIVASDGLALRRALEPALRLLMRGRPLPTVWQL